MNVKKYLKNPKLLLFYMGMRGWWHQIPDETYLKWMYKLHTGKRLNLEKPRTFNEKLQWLKLHDCKSEYTLMVDKYEAKKYVAGRIGAEYIIPTLGVWDHVEEIDFDTLPKQFVMKCTHDSDGLVIVKDKAQMNKAAVKKKIERSLKRNYYYAGREWPYKNVVPRILAETYMEDKKRQELSDYKVMCFGGEPKLIQIHHGRFGNHTQDFYDAEWNKLEIIQGLPMSDEVLEKPVFLEEMLELSRKLSDGVPQMRVDWYFVNDRLYFGELTMFDGSGFSEFEPDYWNLELGNWIRLPEIWSEVM